MLSGTDPARWLVSFDFDGTLSPIVPRPEDAVLDPGLVPLLARMGTAVGWLAVVSGRDRAFLSGRLDGALLLGSYGLELPPEVSATGLPEDFPAAGVRTRLQQAEGDLQRAIARFPGSRLEVKPWGLALHHRGAGPEFDPVAAQALAESVAAARGLRLQPGRLVLELKPMESVDKGWAMRRLATTFAPAAVVFVGDDLGDKPAWEAIRAMQVPALAVGISSVELPNDALAACNLVLGSRDELAPFMEALTTAAEAGVATDA